MESSSALGVIIIDAVGAVISLACIVFILTKSKEVVIKRSQPFFMVMFLVGALVCQVASIPFLGVADDVSCALRPLLISTGAALMLSSLVVKMLRIKKILSMADKLVSKAVMVKDLLPTFLTMYAVALGIWVVYVATEAPEKTPSIRTIDEYNTVLQYKCSSTNVFETLLMFYVCGLLIYACILAYQIRQMPGDLQETKALLFSAYTIFLFAAFGIPLLFLVNDTMIKVLLMSVFINVPVIVTVTLVCLPKFFVVLGIKFESDTPSVIQTLQSAYRTNKVTPTTTTPSLTTTTTPYTTTTPDGGATSSNDRATSSND